MRTLYTLLAVACLLSAVSATCIAASFTAGTPPGSGVIRPCGIKIIFFFFGNKNIKSSWKKLKMTLHTTNSNSKTSVLITIH